MAEDGYEMEKRVNSSRPKLPKSVVAAFLVLLVLAVLVTYWRRPPAGEGPRGAGAVDPAPQVQDEPPSRAVLSETRKQGSYFDCTVVGRIEGTMRQTTALKAYHPIFAGEIKSRWIVPWTTRFRAEVLRNDGRTIRERRTFEEVRSVELMAPAELAALTYDLDPKINKLITRLATRLRQAYPGNPASEAMGALIRSQDFNYAEIARLTGIDERILSRQEAVVAAAATILDQFEGKSVEVSLKEGRTEWVYAPDLPKPLVKALGRIHSLIDYSALPSPSLAVGERTVLSGLVINEMLPPDLVREVLGDFDTSLTLELTRGADREEEGRKTHRFDGDGRLELRQLDGNAFAELRVERAELWIDVTDPTNRYLHRLELSMPLATEILASHSRFRKVAWEGDLVLAVRYEVEQAP